MIKQMNITLLKGSFEPAELADLMRSLVKVKISFHEDKIRSEDSEEQIKMREARIRQLQNELSEVLADIRQASGPLNAEANVTLEAHEQ